VHSAQVAFTSGMHIAVLAGAGFTLVGALLAFLFLPAGEAPEAERAAAAPVPA
jgi:hypothetical protein